MKLFEDLKRDIELPDTPWQKAHLWYLRFHQERYCSDIAFIEKYYRSGQILEIGSHPYHLTYALKRLGYDVVGLDIDPSRYNHFIKKHNLNIVPCDIDSQPIPFKDDTFQLIVFNEVFEHLRIDVINTLKEINRVLSPGGVLILSTPNLYALHRILLFLIGRGIKDPYVAFKQMHDIGHMGHLREYSVKEVKKFLVNTGFECFDVKHMTYKFVIKGNWGKLANIVYIFTPRIFSSHFILFSRKPEKEKTT
jgi:SAM-dependent methyltransferase